MNILEFPLQRLGFVPPGEISTDVLVHSKAGGLCSHCLSSIAPKSRVRVVIVRRLAGAISAYRFCTHCCKCMTASDFGAALDERVRLPILGDEHIVETFGPLSMGRLEIG